MTRNNGAFMVLFKSRQRSKMASTNNHEQQLIVMMMKGDIMASIVQSGAN